MELHRPASPLPPATATGDVSGEVGPFLSSGVYGLPESNDSLAVVFVDPVRVLNRHSYSRFRVSASCYYSRSFPPKSSSSSSFKRKRSKPPRPRELNERERAAERRHQEVRPFLLRAHEALLRERSLLVMLPDLVKGGEFGCAGSWTTENDFVALGKLWQAPMYEMEFCSGVENILSQNEGSCHGQCSEKTLVPVFNNLIFNTTEDDIEVNFLESSYVLPRQSGFHMSDISQIRNLIPADSEHGYNLIVIDPPWENRSADQKAMYPVLPNRYFLHLPIKQLAHGKGALLLLWVTNREKLRLFVENELLAAWGVSNAVECHWLKVKMDGSLISELDLFHHRPYESFLLGYINCKKDDLELEGTLRYPQNNQVFISIPGAYSRKPPIGPLLSDYVPGPKPLKCIELFARELHAGWTSWGNETLRFQDFKYFLGRGL